MGGETQTTAVGVATGLGIVVWLGTAVASASSTDSLVDCATLGVADKVGIGTIGNVVAVPDGSVGVVATSTATGVP